jgi:hypothetical protein
VIPIWVVNAFVLGLGCILAILVGSTLPQLDILGGYLTIMLVICLLCVVFDSLPLLIAFSIWTPIPIPVPFFRNFPTLGMVLMFCLLTVFFKVCRTRQLDYVRSFNYLFLGCFLWVPIRFLMNPIHKLGVSVMGGSGVSGMAPYFGYALAGLLMVLLGGILYTKERIYQAMTWSVRICFAIGVILLICAFHPSWAPYLNMLGIFTAGDLNGILRIPSLPSPGEFLIGAALCPAFFRFKIFHVVPLIILGVAMEVAGANRSTAVATMILVPTILLIRRKFLTLGAFCGLTVLAGLFLYQWTMHLAPGEDPGVGRVLGVISPEIDKASGGTASAQWRYQVWDSGMRKIMEAPLVGWGYGNLPQNLDPSKMAPGDSTDFETVLAGGMAHNGFVNASYGFGIPFMLALTLAIVFRTVRHGYQALVFSGRDAREADFHALIAGTLASTFIMIYTAWDISTSQIWLLISSGIIWDHLSRSRKNVSVRVPVKREPWSEDMLAPGREIEPHSV